MEWSNLYSEEKVLKQLSFSWGGSCGRGVKKDRRKGYSFTASLLEGKYFNLRHFKIQHLIRRFLNIISFKCIYFPGLSNSVEQISASCLGSETRPLRAMVYFAFRYSHKVLKTPPLPLPLGQYPPFKYYNLTLPHIKAKKDSLYNHGLLCTKIIIFMLLNEEICFDPSMISSPVLLGVQSVCSLSIALKQKLHASYSLWHFKYQRRQH